jgi:DNA-binding HxlR family transcriptional regulator
METPTHGKTYQILNSILAGNRTLTAVANATGLHRRCVNSLVYALEKQGRVAANDYADERGKLEFSVTRYEADLTKGYARVHPTKQGRTHLACQRHNTTPIHELQRLFFSTPIPNSQDNTH